MFFRPKKANFLIKHLLRFRGGFAGGGCAPCEMMVVATKCHRMHIPVLLLLAPQTRAASTAASLRGRTVFTGLTPVHRCTRPRGGSGLKVPEAPKRQFSSSPPEATRPSAISVTLATQNEGRCHYICATLATQPHKQSRRPQEPSTPPEATLCQKRDACHTEWSATPAAQNGGWCFQMPRLPHKQPQRPRNPSAPPEAT